MRVQPVRALVDGMLPEQGVNFLEGLIIVVIIVAIFLGLYIKIKSIRKELKEEAAKERATRDEEIKEKILLQQTLTDIKNNHYRMNDSLCSLTESLKINFDKLDKKVEKHDALIVQVLSSTRSAHKRIDEHRTVEHNVKNGRSHPNVDDEQDETYKKDWED